MVAGEDVQPWTGLGGKYESSSRRVMVLGDTPIEAPLTDRETILRKIGAARDVIFTNFAQAILGKRQWEDGYREQVREFWERTAFYNYNVTFSPATGGASLTWERRLDPIHARVLRKILITCKPTHVIVWGDDNWRAVAVEGAAWEAMDDIRCGAFDEPCRAVVTDGHRSLFTRVAHPSAGFSYERWSLLLPRFLSLHP